MEIRYFGWSGVLLRHGATAVGFDLPGTAAVWRSLAAVETAILCVTHGHPDHCGSLRRLLTLPEARLAQTHVIASAAVLKRITAGVPLRADHIHPTEPGHVLALNVVRVTTFAWRHTPLLPPGLGNKASYAGHVLSRPLVLAGIVAASLRLPLQAPMHGFHVAFANGPSALNYAEGLHRLTDPAEVAATAQRLPADVLLCAVEPEDVGDIPRWIEVLAPSSVILYEAHRPWRESFRLPYVDLAAYAAQLGARLHSIRFGALLTEGEVIAHSS